MNWKKVLCAVFLACSAASASLAPLATHSPSDARALETEPAPLPGFSPLLTEAGEKLFFTSERVTLDARSLTGMRCAVGVESVSTLKNAGPRQTAAIAVPFCGYAKSPPGVTVTVDGDTVLGRVVYGEEYVRGRDQGIPSPELAAPQTRGGGTLYVFDTAGLDSLQYTLRYEKGPLFHGGCNRFTAAENVFSAVWEGVGESYELFVGGDSEIETANAAYSQRELTYDEYFERSYALFADDLAAPREYHYTRYAAAVASGTRTNAVDFYLDGDETEIVMFYVFDLEFAAGEEKELTVVRDAEAAADASFEPYLWRCEYRRAFSSPCSCRLLVSDCPYLWESETPFERTKEGYEYAAADGAERIRIALCASEAPRGILQPKRKSATKTIVAICLAALLCGALGSGVIFYVFKRKKAGR